MKLKFDIKITEKELFAFNLEQAYKGIQGVVSIVFGIIIIAAVIFSAIKGNAANVIMYIVVGLIVLLYVPVSLKGRVKISMKSNEVFTKPLHFTIDEKQIGVSQGKEAATLPWEDVYRFVANDRRILIFSNRKNAYIMSKEQLGDNFDKLKDIAEKVLEKHRISIKNGSKASLICDIKKKIKNIKINGKR